MKKDLKSKIGNKEIFKFLKDSIENSQNILIVIDNEKPEFTEIIETYTDTWGKMVRITILKEYYKPYNSDDSILAMTPDFENIETIDIVSTDQEGASLQTKYTVDFHLDGIPEDIRNLYDQLITKVTNSIPSLSINPQRYYISLRKKRNFAFLKIRRKKVAIVAMMREDIIRERVKHYHIETLSQGVQNFYNGPCARIDFINNKYMREVVDLLIQIQK